MTAEGSGRRAGARLRRVALWLPDDDGGIRPDEVAAPVVPLRGSSQERPA